MLEKFITTIKFIKLLINYGRPLSNSDVSRYNSSKNLEIFIPSNFKALSKIKKRTWPVPFKHIIILFAFFKNNISAKGGHLTIDKRQLSYIRIPKSGSTSISFSFLNANYPLLKNHNLTDEQINFITDRNLIQQATNMDDLYFTVVRNPFSRIVSVYRDFFENNSTSFIYGDYLLGVIRKDLSFTEFLKRISEIPDFLKDQHIKPQCEFLKYYENKGLKIKTIKLEDTDSLNGFLNFYGLVMHHKNKSTSYELTSYYDNISLELAYNIYKKDIDRFDYEFDYLDLKRRIK